MVKKHSTEEYHNGYIVLSRNNETYCDEQYVNYLNKLWISQLIKK